MSKKQKSLQELIKPYTVSYISKITGINYNTLQAQLNPNHRNRITEDTEYRIRQALTQ